MLMARSQAEVAGTYSSTHPMEGEGLRRGHISWTIVMRDGPEAPWISTRAELEAFLEDCVRRDPQPDLWEGTFVVRLGSHGRFAFYGPLNYGDASPVMVSGTWRLVGSDVVLSPARATPETPRLVGHEIVCHLGEGCLYFPWGEPALMGQELLLVKR